MTIQTDVSDTTNGMSDDAAVSALIDQMKVDPKGPAASSGEDDEDLDDADDGDDQADNADLNDEDGDADPNEDGEDDEASDEGDEGEEDEGEDEQEAPSAPAAPADDAVVKVTVNGEETEVTVGSLKRLAGQEAALTRKSQEADLVGSRAAAMIQGALGAIIEDLEPYQNIDWLVAQQEMEPEEFKWHRDNFARSNQRYQRLMQQAGELEQVATTRRQTAVAEQAREASAELTKDITGWSDKLYGEIMEYGVSQGLDPDDVASITNAKVIKILHKAMLADRAEKVVAKKVNQTPKRVRKGGGEEAPSTGKRQRILEKKLASGRATDDDAVALLMGRWSK